MASGVGINTISSILLHLSLWKYLAHVGCRCICVLNAQCIHALAFQRCHASVEPARRLGDAWLESLFLEGFSRHFVDSHCHSRRKRFYRKVFIVDSSFRNLHQVCLNKFPRIIPSEDGCSSERATCISCCTIESRISKDESFLEHSNPSIYTILFRSMVRDHHRQGERRMQIRF